MGRPRRNPLTIDKVCPTCNKTFIISYRKKRQIYCSRTCANHDPAVIERMIKSQRETSFKKYGVEHPMKTKEVVNNFKKAMFDKYGVEHSMQKKEFKDKSKETKLERYGNENYVNVEKIKQTCLQKYGVSNYRNTDEYKEKFKKTCLEKYGVEHSSQSKQYKNAHKLNMFKKFIISDRFKNFEPTFTMDEYNGVTTAFNKKYPFKCKRCSTISEIDIADGRYPECPICDKTNISNFQKGIFSYITTLTNEPVIENDRSLLYPRELDIYIPSKKLAIECNGLFWHSEAMGNKNKTYHINKTRACMAKEVSLIHIMEYEWNYRKDIVKSILRVIFDKITNRIFARKCEIKEVNKDDCRLFLYNNHIQGDDKSSWKYGLYYNNELVSIMTFCKSRFDKKATYEMSRYCNKLDTIVVGGASKLFKHFAKDLNDEDTIVSYSDRRYFDGSLYNKLGFKFISNTPPNYYYTTDGYNTVQSRQCFQKHKLKKMLPIFDENLSEWENMKINGYDRIFDCGHSKWLFRNEYPNN